MCIQCEDRTDGQSIVEFKPPWVAMTIAEVMNYIKKRDASEVDIRDEAIQAAALFLVEVSVYKVNPPVVYPVPGGGLAFEFMIGSRSLDVKVSPDGQNLEFLLCIAFPGGTDDLVIQNYELGSIPIDSVKSTCLLAQWLLSGEIPSELTTYLCTDEEIEARCSGSENGSNSETTNT